VSLLGPIVSSFQALAGRLKFTARRHKFNKDALFGDEGAHAYSTHTLPALSLAWVPERKGNNL